VRGTGLTGVVPRCWAILSTGLTDEGDRSDRSELSCCNCSVSCGVLHAFVQGGCIGSGELTCVQGELFVVFRALDWWFALFA
jgi:hypothetical protein